MKKQALDLSHLEKLKNDPKKFVAAMKQAISTMSREFKPADREESLKYFNDTVGILRKDSDRSFILFDKAFSGWAADPQNSESLEEMQYMLRQLIRTFFAEVEGTLYAARRVILWAHERGEFPLTNAEIAVLREETYKFNSRTMEVEARPAFSTTKESFLLVFTVFPRLLDSGFKLNLSDNGWECFQKLLDVRHELTHPKEVVKHMGDAEVTMTIMPRARVWYYETLKEAVGLKKK